MSHKLHIGPTDKLGFDCVIESPEGAAEKLRSEWLKGGPYKISIGDIALFRAIQPAIKEELEQVGEEYPEGIWGFWINGRHVCWGTQQELDEFIERHTL